MIHRVRAGETLSAIARRYRVSLGALHTRNPAVQERPIQPGDVLVVR